MAVSLTSSTTRTTSEVLSFVKVKKDTELFDKIKGVFKAIFEPLYGNQDDALKKIQKRKVRCEMLMEGEKKSLGFIVYKKELQAPLSVSRTENSFEVKNFHVFDSSDNQKNSSLLLNRILKLAKREEAKEVHISVPSNHTGTIDFLKQCDFATLDGRGSSPARPSGECLMHYTLPLESSERKRKSEEPSKTPAPEDDRYSKKQKSKHSTDVSGAPAPVPVPAPAQHQRNDARSGFGKALQRSSSFLSPSDERPRMGFQPHQPLQRAQSTSALPTGQPRTHEIPLKKFYLNQVLRGKKTVEGRINSGKMKQLRSGDEIRFFYTEYGRKVEAVCRVVEIKTFTSFREMLSHYGVNKCLAEATSIEQGVRIYDELPGFAERARTSGVLGIELELLRS